MTTRFERILNTITAYEISLAIDGVPDAEDTARLVLQLADDRTFWGNVEISDYIGRPAPIWATWQERGSHNVPSPAYETRSGKLWDAADVRDWAVDPDHLHLLGEGSEARTSCLVQIARRSDL